MLDVIIIRGPLGVGKTSTAIRLAKDLSAQYFSVDDILADNNLDKVEDGIPVENFLKVNEILIPKVNELLQKQKSSIIDGNFYYKEVIEDLENKLFKKPKIFSLIAPLSICIARDAARQNSHGQFAARAVYDLVAKFNFGKEIKANEKDIEEIILEIKKDL